MVLALGATLAVAALIVRLALTPVLGSRAPFAIVFVVVVCATILGGWRSGVVATVIGQILAWFLIYEPAYSFELATAADGWSLSLATFCQLSIVGVVALYQREIRRQQEAREILVAELTIA